MPQKIPWATLNAQYFFNPLMVNWVIDQIAKRGLWGICFQEFPRFQESYIMKIIEDPRLEGEWGYLQAAYPEKMGYHHGMVILYRKDLLQLKSNREIWLPESGLPKEAPTQQVALVCTLQYQDNIFQVANMRFAYEPDNNFRLKQLRHVAENMEDIPTVLCGDSNLKCFSQLKSPLGLLSLIFPIPAQWVVENRQNRSKINKFLPGYENVIPSGAYTIEPFRSLPPGGREYKINQLYRRITQIVFGRPRNIRLLMQLDYVLAKLLHVVFGEIIDTEYCDHSLITFYINLLTKK